MSDAPLMLGVSGARGIVGKTMTPAVVRRFARAWGAKLSADLEQPLVCLGRDSRPSGEALAAAAASGLVDAGCTVVDLGLVATPTVGVMIGALQAAGGVVVTASHNPTPWNGLKLLDEHGTAPGPDIAADVIAAFERDTDEDRGETTGPTVDQRGTDTHIAKVIGRVDPMPLRARGFSVVLDSVNGAGCQGGACLLEAMGCTLVHLGSVPDGAFPHEPEPIAANLTGLSDAVREHGADVGFAQDPDADRLAIVDETGRYVGEEYTLVLAAMRVLRDLPGASVVANLSTSRMIDDLVKARGGQVHRSAVGEANVAALMRARDAAIGGEGNGGVILPDVTWVRDSLSGMALVLDLMRVEDRPLSAIINSMPAYVIVKEKFNLARREDLDQAFERLRTGFAGERLNDADGLRIDLDDCWAHVRASNTEPIARIIVEARDSSSAQALLEQVRQVAGL